MTRKQKPSPLTKALRETAEGMHAAGLLDAATRERIVARLDERTTTPARRSRESSRGGRATIKAER